MSADRPGSTTPEPPADAAARVFSMPVRLGFFLLASSAGVLGARAAFNLWPPSLLGLSVPTFYLQMAVGLVLGHWWTFRAVEPRGWRSIGFGRGDLTPRSLGIGTLLGAAAVGVPSLMLLLFGWLRVEPSASGSWLGAALATLAVLLPAALWEELLSRGYAFTSLREVLGTRRTIVVTAGVFGLLHVQNAGATWQSVALVTLAGIFLGGIRVATGSLYAAWAAHVAWNFVMAGVLHSAVSGIGMDAPNYRIVDAGPDWATGGAWGPEAGLLTAVGLAAGIYLMLRRRAAEHTHD